jgi:hypothetical protein
MTCPGLEAPIDSFITLNSKGALEAWAECPRGVRIPSPLHFSHIHSEKTQQPATLNSEPALLPHLKQPNKSQFDKKFTTSPCQTSKIFHGSFENG